MPVEQLALAHRSLRAPLDTNSKEGLFCAESASMAVMIMVGQICALCVVLDRVGRIAAVRIVAGEPRPPSAGVTSKLP